jgi:hypothetical protein
MWMSKTSMWRSQASRVAALLIVVTLLVPGATPTMAAPPEQAGCVYRAAFLGDVTVPDNTVIPGGTSFIKTWRLRNDGTCAWGPGQTVDTIALVGGTSLGNSTIIPLVNEIRPGRAGEISVAFIAPTAAGTHRSEWMLRRTNGQMFGIGASGRTPFYVQFVVRSGGGGSTGERIQFAPGATTASVSGRVTFPARRSYLIRARGGQHMTLAIVSANEKANFMIQGVSDGVPYKRLENEDRYFPFTLPTTQDYLVSVATAEGSADYILSVAIAP